jgi:hypothetical protein
MSNRSAAQVAPILPRFIRAKQAPAYLGMCRAVFDAVVRPHIRELPIGKQGAGFGGRSERSGVKNRDERLVILNSVAKSIIEKQRGQHKHFVFPFGMPDEDGNPTMIHRMNDSAWK